LSPSVRVRYPGSWFSLVAPKMLRLLNDKLGSLVLNIAETDILSRKGF